MKTIKEVTETVAIRGEQGKFATHACVENGKVTHVSAFTITTFEPDYFNRPGSLYFRNAHELADAIQVLQELQSLLESYRWR